MRHTSTVLTRHIATIALLLGLGPAPALAQDSSDTRALDSLGTPPSHRKPAPRARHGAHHAGPAHKSDATPAAAVPPPIPAAPPPPPVITAPLINVPLHPEAPPPPVPVVATAIGGSTPIDHGTRVSFGAGTADMNQTTIQSVQAIAAVMKTDPATRAQIDAYAPGAADDPSSPRRTALERGLAARAVLINAGIPSTRIYVRAIGQPQDGGPADRIDLTYSDSTRQTDTQQTGAQQMGTTP